MNNNGQNGQDCCNNGNMSGISIGISGNCNGDNQFIGNQNFEGANICGNYINGQYVGNNPNQEQIDHFQELMEELEEELEALNEELERTPTINFLKRKDLQRKIQLKKDAIEDCQTELENL